MFSLFAQSTDLERERENANQPCRQTKIFLPVVNFSSENNHQATDQVEAKSLDSLPLLHRHLGSRYSYQPITLFQAHEQGASCSVELLGLNKHPWNAGFVGGTLACSVTTSTPVKNIFKKYAGSSLGFSASSWVYIHLIQSRIVFHPEI